MATIIRIMIIVIMTIIIIIPSISNHKINIKSREYNEVFK